MGISKQGEQIAKVTAITVNGKEFRPFKPYQGLDVDTLKHLLKHNIDSENYEECAKIRDAMEAQDHSLDMNDLPEDTSLRCSGTLHLR